MRLDNIFTVIGYICYGFIATMQIPQIYHTVKNKKLRTYLLILFY